MLFKLTADYFEGKLSFIRQKIPTSVDSNIHNYGKFSINKDDLLKARITGDCNSSHFNVHVFFEDGLHDKRAIKILKQHIRKIFSQIKLDVKNINSETKRYNI